MRKITSMKNLENNKKMLSVKCQKTEISIINSKDLLSVKCPKMEISKINSKKMLSVKWQIGFKWSSVVVVVVRPSVRRLDGRPSDVVRPSSSVVVVRRFIGPAYY